MWLSAHELYVLQREPGPPFQTSFVTARTMASFVAGWSIGHCPTEPYPRVETGAGRRGRHVALGGTRTPLLSDAALWRLTGRTGPVNPHFARSLDLEFPCLYARTLSLAEAAIHVRDLLRGVGICPDLQAPVTKTRLGGLALMGQRMLPHFLEVVLAECLPGRPEDRRRMWTMAAAGIFRDTSSTVANAAVPRGTYTVAHLERAQGASRERALIAVVGAEEAASGRFASARECPLPAVASVPVPPRRHEFPRMDLEERHDLLNDSVRGLSEVVAKTVSAAAQGRDDVARLRDEFGQRLAAIEARAPGEQPLATMDDFATNQQHAWRLADAAMRQCDHLTLQVQSLCAGKELVPGILQAARPCPTPPP